MRCLSPLLSQKRNIMEEKIKERNYLWIKIAVALLCTAFLVCLVVVQYIFRTYSTYRVVGETAVVSEESNRSCKLGDHLILYNKDGMRCLDMKGRAVWDVTYQIQEPCIVVDDNTAAVAGYGDNLIYIVDESGKIGEIKTNLPIRNLCVSKAGYVGAVLDDNDVYWIYVFDVKGNEIIKARTTMEQSGYPLSISLSPNAKLLGVSFLYLDAGTVQSNVAFYNLGEVGQNYTGQYMSGYKYEEVVSEIHYMTNSVAMAISDGRFMVYEGTEKPILIKSVMLNDAPKAVYWGDEYAALVYNGTAGQSKYQIQIFDLAGEVVQEIALNSEYSDIKIQNGIVTIYDSDEILVYTLDGKQRFSGNFGESVLAVEPTSKKYRYMVLGEENYRIIELE